MGNNKQKTILLTGAAGFIGSNVLEYLFYKYPDYKFIVIDALTYAGDIRNIGDEIQKSERFTFWYGDVRNAKLVDKLVEQSDVVIHFAAETHVTRSIYDNLRFFETDVMGTQVVANAVLQNQGTLDRFIHISTSEVYGTALTPLMNEEHPLNPYSPYAAAKVGADRLVYSYVVTYNIPAVIVRPFNIYGPRQHLEKVIPRFITSCLLGEDLTVHGDGESRRDFTNVKDLADCLDLIIHSPLERVRGQIFNVGAGEDYSVKEIAQKIYKIMKPPSSQITYQGDRPGQVVRHTADSFKVKEYFGWQKTINFDDGLRQLIDWYSKNEDWWRPKIWMRRVPIITASGKVEMH